MGGESEGEAATAAVKQSDGAREMVMKFHDLAVRGHRHLASALILGGALGNLWDRIQYGYVIDFLDFHIGQYHWPIFNAADTAITIGAIMLLIDVFFTAEK